MKKITYKVKDIEVKGTVFDKVLVPVELTITAAVEGWMLLNKLTQRVAVHKFIIRRDDGQIDLIFPQDILSIDDEPLKSSL